MANISTLSVLPSAIKTSCLVNLDITVTRAVHAVTKKGAKPTDFLLPERTRRILTDVSQIF